MGSIRSWCRLTFQVVPDLESAISLRRFSKRAVEFAAQWFEDAVSLSSRNQNATATILSVCSD